MTFFHGCPAKYRGNAGTAEFVLPNSPHLNMALIGITKKLVGGFLNEIWAISGLWTSKHLIIF